MKTSDRPIYIDPHIHMTSRTADDYKAMKSAGLVAVIEPAVRPSWRQTGAGDCGAYKDYFNNLIGWERFRASQYGVCHYCTVGLHPRDANNQALAEQVMALLPAYASKEGVVAIGAIGLDESTVLEERYFRKQLELARVLDALVLISTPRRNKKTIARRSMALCEEHRLSPQRVILDHCDEETIGEALDRGYWAAVTIHAAAQRGKERMVDVVEEYGCERVIIDSSADWSSNDPLAVPRMAALMRKRGLPDEVVDRVCYRNAVAAYAQSGQMEEADWLHPYAGEQDGHDPEAAPLTSPPLQSVEPPSSLTGR